MFSILDNEYTYHKPFEQLFPGLFRVTIVNLSVDSAIGEGRFVSVPIHRSFSNESKLFELNKV